MSDDSSLQQKQNNMHLQLTLRSVGNGESWNSPKFPMENFTAQKIGEVQLSDWKTVKVHQNTFDIARKR